MATIRLNIDASQAQTGAAQYARAISEIRAANVRGSVSVDEFSSSLAGLEQGLGGFSALSQQTVRQGQQFARSMSSGAQEIQNFTRATRGSGRDLSDLGEGVLHISDQSSKLSDNAVHAANAAADLGNKAFEASAGTRDLGAGVDAATRTMTTFSGSVEAVADSLVGAGATNARVAKRVKEMADRAFEATEKTKNLGSQAGTSASQMRKLSEEAKAANQALARTKAASSRAGQEVEALSGRMDRAISAAKGLGAALIGVGVVRTLISTVRELNLSLLQTGSATGLVGDQARLMDQRLKTMGFSAKQADGAMRSLANAGADANEAVNSLVTTMSLARASSLTLVDSAEFVVTLLRDYGIEAEKTDKALNALFAVQGRGIAPLRGTTEALTEASSAAAFFNVSLADTLGAVVEFERAGVRGKRAGQEFNTALLALGGVLPEVRDSLKAAGVNVTDFDLQSNNLTDVLNALAEQGFGNLARSVDAFGERAGPAIAHLTRMREAIAKTSSATKDAREDMTDLDRIMSGRLQSGFKIAEASAFDLLRRIGGSGSDSSITWALKTMSAEVTGVLRVWAGLGSSLGEGEAHAIRTAHALESLALAVGTASAAFVAFRIVMSGAVVQMAASISGLAASLLTLNGITAALGTMAATLGPIGLGAAAIGTLTAAFYFLRDSTDESTISVEGMRNVLDNLNVDATTAQIDRAKEHLDDFQSSVKQTTATIEELQRVQAAREAGTEGGFFSNLLNSLGFGEEANQKVRIELDKFRNEIIRGGGLTFEAAMEVSNRFGTLEGFELQLFEERELAKLQAGKAAVGELNETITDLNRARSSLDRGPLPTNFLGFDPITVGAVKDALALYNLSLADFSRTLDSVQTPMEKFRDEVSKLEIVQGILEGLGKGELFSDADMANRVEELRKQFFKTTTETDRLKQMLEGTGISLSRYNDILRMGVTDADDYAKTIEQIGILMDRQPENAEAWGRALASVHTEMAGLGEAIGIANGFISDQQTEREALTAQIVTMTEALARAEELQTKMPQQAEQWAEQIGTLEVAIGLANDKLKDMDSIAGQLREIGSTVWSAMSSGIRGAIIDGDSFTGTLRNMARAMAELAVQMLILRPLFKGLSFLGGGFLDIFTGATGLSGRVAGSGGTDSQLIPLQLTPGELIDVRTPAQEAERVRTIKQAADVADRMSGPFDTMQTQVDAASPTPITVNVQAAQAPQVSVASAQPVPVEIAAIEASPVEAPRMEAVTLPDVNVTVPPVEVPAPEVTVPPAPPVEAPQAPDVVVPPIEVPQVASVVVSDIDIPEPLPVTIPPFPDPSFDVPPAQTVAVAAEAPVVNVAAPQASPIEVEPQRPEPRQSFQGGNISEMSLSNVEIRVINKTNQDVEITDTGVSTENGRLVFEMSVKNVLMADMRERGPFTRAMQQITGPNRHGGIR